MMPVLLAKQGDAACQLRSRYAEKPSRIKTEEAANEAEVAAKARVDSYCRRGDLAKKIGDHRRAATIEKYRVGPPRGLPKKFFPISLPEKDLPPPPNTFMELAGCWEPHLSLQREQAARLCWRL